MQGSDKSRFGIPKNLSYRAREYEVEEERDYREVVEEEARERNRRRGGGSGSPNNHHQQHSFKKVKSNQKHK